MFSWSFRRRFLYIFILALIVVPPTAFYIWKSQQKQPSCTDGKQNQDERGVDCGGVCKLACFFEVTAEPTVQWSRAYYVAKGVYNLVAYIQNPNVNFVSKSTPYIFRIYDENNVLLASRAGEVALPTAKLFPIFEAGIDVGERIPKKVVFEFTEPLTWVEYDVDRPELSVSNVILSRTDDSPKLSAKISNTTLNQYRGVEVVAILYDIEGNGFAASRTFIDRIGDKQTKDVYFTWPEAFTASTSRIEIIPKLALPKTR